MILLFQKQVWIKFSIASQESPKPKYHLVSSQENGNKDNFTQIQQHTCLCMSTKINLNNFNSYHTKCHNGTKENYNKSKTKDKREIS